MATYHRPESPTQSLQVAIYQTHSNEIWGAAARGSNIPSVKAYVGPLPANRSGVEFETNIPPNAGSTPTVAKWYLGYQAAVTAVPGGVYCRMSVTMLSVKSTMLGISCRF